MMEFVVNIMPKQDLVVYPVNSEPQRDSDSKYRYKIDNNGDGDTDDDGEDNDDIEKNKRINIPLCSKLECVTSASKALR